MPSQTVPLPGNDDDALDRGTIVIEEERLKETFTQIPNTILKRAELSPGAKLTYIGLLSYAWQEDSCFPGQTALARDIGAGERSVRRYLQELQEQRLLSIKRRGLGKTNVYTLLSWDHFQSGQIGRSRTAKSAVVEVPNWPPNNTQLEKYSSKHTISKYSKGKTSASEVSDLEPQSEQGRQVSLRRPSTPTSIGALLVGVTPIRARSAAGRLSPRIVELITTWSEEWHDSVHLRSNLTQVRHIQEECQWSDAAFVQVLIQAHSTTKQDGHAARKKMPYCFAVLRDLVGLRSVADDSDDAEVNLRAE